MASGSDPRERPATDRGAASVWTLPVPAPDSRVWNRSSSVSIGADSVTTVGNSRLYRWFRIWNSFSCAHGVEACAPSPSSTSTGAFRTWSKSRS